MIRWTISLFGLALSVFALAALTGPGRIDIEDGQARYEAGNSLIVHGDPGIRDRRVVWHRFPGRDGIDFTYYRVGGEMVAAIFVAVGRAVEADESLSHFIFSLNSAVTASLLAAVYAVWFRRQNMAIAPALGWAFTGIVCTPCWYYATSTFDDLLGTLVVVAAIVSADLARKGHALALLAAALLVGLALNCKQPLAAILLPAIAFADDRSRPTTMRFIRAGVLMLGLAAGSTLYVAYEAWKFPPEEKAKHAAIFAEQGMDVFAGNPAEALLDFAIGPSSGAVWYCPTLVLCLAGMLTTRASDRWRKMALLTACLVIAVFYSFLSFYKGGVNWGPRYLTPIFGLLWLYAPAGAQALGLRLTRLLLILGFCIQVMALAVVPERLYVERALPTGFYMIKPWWYFHPAISHVMNRPREILDACTAPAAAEFSPGPTPTFTMPVFDPPFYTGPKGIAGVRQYTLLNELRPWWATFPHLPHEQRPVAIPTALTIFALIGVIGAGLMLPAICTREID